MHPDAAIHIQRRLSWNDLTIDEIVNHRMSTDS